MSSKRRPFETRPAHSFGELSPQQRKILMLASTGLKRDAIATRLNIGRRTVDSQLLTVYRRTGAHSLVEALNAVDYHPARLRQPQPWERLDGDLVAVPADVYRQLRDIARGLTSLRPDVAAAQQRAASVLRDMKTSA